MGERPKEEVVHEALREGPSRARHRGGRAPRGRLQQQRGDDRPGLAGAGRIARPRPPRPRPSRRRRPSPRRRRQSAAAKTWKIGYSNGGSVGNGFREEQVCTAKAEALASGQVSELTTIHRNTDAAGQLQDIRDLIAKGVDAIVFNPNDPNALNPALQEANAAGIKTVSVDAYVTDPTTYNLYNNQVEYAYVGAKWLFEKLGGKGTVYYSRGLAGHPADSDRDIGFKKALAEYPDIKVVPTADGVFTGWDPATATQNMNDFIASGQYDKIDGIWSSGMGKQTIDAIKAANKKFVPIVDADIGGFVAQLLDPTGFPGLEGAAVTNTAAVGGAGVNLALKLLNGETVQTDPSASQPNTVLLVAGHQGQHDRPGQGGPQGVAGPGTRSALAARPRDPRLDHVHPGAGGGLQGPRRPVGLHRSR